MPYITVDTENSADVLLYYEDHGVGQPVVMIHGFPLSGDAWEKQKIALVKEGFRTITYDRRGFGRSDKPAFGYDYDTLASDLDHIIKKLDLQNAILMGHSMGTGEVTRYLSTYGSDRISRAVLISPIPPYLLKSDDNMDGVDKSVFDQIQNAILDDRLAYLTDFLQNFYNLEETLGKRVSKEVVQANWNTASEASPLGTLDCVSAWLTDFRNDLPKIDVPTLIIQGDSDRILPIEKTGNVLSKALSGSKFAVIKGGPHGIPWTHAEEVNHEILAFAAQPAVQESRERTGQGRFPAAEPAFGEKIEEDRPDTI